MLVPHVFFVVAMMLRLINPHFKYIIYSMNHSMHLQLIHQHLLENTFFYICDDGAHR